MSFVLPWYPACRGMAGVCVCVYLCVCMWAHIPLLPPRRRDVMDFGGVVAALAAAGAEGGEEAEEGEEDDEPEFSVVTGTFVARRKRAGAAAREEGVAEGTLVKSAGAQLAVRCAYVRVSMRACPPA